MFNWGVDQGVLDASPCVGVKRPGKEVRRERTLSDDELRALWNGLQQAGIAGDTAAALKLQLLTACRIGEICGAQWSEIDLAKAEWLIPGKRAKNGRECLVPLSENAIEILKAQDQSGAHVFPAAREEILPSARRCRDP